MEPIDFAAFLKEKIKAKGFTLRKVSDLSGIPLKHLEHLSNGEYDRLPPAPYVRGYLNVLGPLLQFDAAAVWDHFKATNAILSSGSTDRLPQNRFAPRSMVTYIWVGIAALLLLGYLGFRFSKIFGQPVLRIDAPQETLTRVEVRDFTASGRLENGDTLFINGETVSLDANGGWQKRLLLQPGLNTIEFSAKKFLGNEAHALRQVMYEPLPAPPPLSSSSTNPGSSGR